jgi:hypothetical protein
MSTSLRSWFVDNNAIYANTRLLPKCKNVSGKIAVAEVRIRNGILAIL